MRKRLISPVPEEGVSQSQGWLQLEGLVEVEITSEDAAHPIEAALLPGSTSGWRAAEPGTQTIRLLFARAQPLRRIWLRFKEANIERTQEYVLRWSADGGQAFQEIVRQQWNFSPGGATSQTQDHHVTLPAVTVLELNVIPDISGRPACASLAQLRLA
jgi:hypothetical protein